MSIFRVSRGITSSISIFTKKPISKCFSKYGLITLFWHFTSRNSFFDQFDTQFFRTYSKSWKKIRRSIFLGLLKMWRYYTLLIEYCFIYLSSLWRYYTVHESHLDRFGISYWFEDVHYYPTINVVNPDPYPDWIRSQWGPWIRIRIRFCILIRNRILNPDPYPDFRWRSLYRRAKKY
jgi:hypothetical protein